MNKRVRIFAGILLIALISLSLTANYTYAASNNGTTTFKGSTISTDFILEAMNVYAGRKTAVVVEQHFAGGNLTFSDININDTAFDNLVSMIISFRNGTWARRHWPHPLWPIPPGVYLWMEFEGYSTAESDDALAAATTIKDMVEAELGISGMYLYGFDHSGDKTRVTWASPSFEILEQETGKGFDSFIDYYWEHIQDLYSGSLADLVSPTNIVNAPIGIAVIMLQKNQTSGDFLPILGNAYVKTDGIEMPTNTSYRLSINDITGHTGNITPHEDVRFSVIRVRIPYIGNVTYYSPEPDNLFPDMTGEFNYILNPEGPVNNSNIEDIVIEYNFNYNNETKFPVLKADYSVMPVNPIFDLNTTREIGFMLNVTNVGDETAYNITTAIPVKPQDVEEKSITGDEPANITAIFQWQLIQFLNQSEILEYFEEMANTTLIAAGVDPANNMTLVELLTTYFMYQYALQMISNFKVEMNSTGVSELLYANTTVVYENMYYDPDYLNASEYGLAAVVGEWDKLEPGENVTFSFKIVIPGVQNITNPIADIVNTMTYPSKVNLSYTDPNTGLPAYQEHVVPEGLKDATRDGIIDGLNTLRDRVSSNITERLKGEYLEFGLGPIVEYVDKIGHQMYVAANGIVTQLNEPEPVVLGSVEVEDYSLLIDQNVTATVTVRNVGNADAENVEVTFYHGIANYGFQIRDKLYIGSETVGDLSPGETVEVNFTRIVRTRIGIHPVFAEITYRDDNGKDILVYSNVLFVIVFPKFAQKPEPDYPFPTPELELSRTLDNYTPAVGQTVTVNITVKNVGDEATNIVVVDTINSTGLEPILSSFKVYRDGVDITDDVKIHAFFNRQVGDYRLTKIAILQNYTSGEVIGIYLEPNQTLTITYQATVRSAGGLTIFPLMIIYTSLHPVFAGEGAGEGEGGEGTFKVANEHSPFKYMQEGDNEQVTITSYSNTLSLTLQESARKIPPILVLISAGALVLLVAALVVYMRKRKHA